MVHHSNQLQYSQVMQITVNLDNINKIWILGGALDKVDALNYWKDFEFAKNITE